MTVKRKFITIKDASIRYNKAESTIKKWILDGSLPTILLPDYEKLVDLEFIDAYAIELIELKPKKISKNMIITLEFISIPDAAKRYNRAESTIKSWIYKYDLINSYEFSEDDWWFGNRLILFDRIERCAKELIDKQKKPVKKSVKRYDSERWMTLKEATKQYDRAESTIRNWILKGEITTKYDEKTDELLIDRNEIEEYSSQLGSGFEYEQTVKRKFITIKDASIRYNRAESTIKKWISDRYLGTFFHPNYGKLLDLEVLDFYAKDILGTKAKKTSKNRIIASEFVSITDAAKKYNRAESTIQSWIYKYDLITTYGYDENNYGVYDIGNRLILFDQIESCAKELIDKQKKPVEKPVKIYDSKIWMTLNEAMKQYDRAESTIRNWIRKGDITTEYDEETDELLIDRNDIEEYSSQLVTGFKKHIYEP